MALDPRSLQQRLAELLVEHDVPGAAVSVLADGETCDVAAGVADLRSGVEVTTRTPFMIQSVTKVWTATLVMQLVDDALVDLDAPVVRYLPRFRSADPSASAAITVRQLLTHTGGFEGDLWATTSDGPDALARLVDELVPHQPQHVAPGELYSYCNAGFAVLGRLVEVLRGMPYADALRRRLTGPLGIDGVVTDPDEAVRLGAAIGHVSPRSGAPLRPLLTWAVLPASNPAAGNRLALPASGLTALAGLHLGAAPLLSAESARAMRAPYVDLPRAAAGGPSQQGLGWQLRSGGRVLEHGGGAPGAGAILKVLPEQGVAVAVLANGGGMSALFDALCDELLADLAGLEPTPTGPVPDAAPVDRAQRYTGRYELRNEVATVTADPAGRLWLTQEMRGEATEMDERAGVEPEASVTELRRLAGETFVLVDADGHRAGSIEFVGTDTDGRARFLHRGRAVPRVD